MAINERLIDAAMPLMDVLKPRAEYDRARRVERGLDNQGKPILDGHDYLPVRSPDGSVWRIRVTNAGVVIANKEVS